MYFLWLTVPIACKALRRVQLHLSVLYFGNIKKFRQELSPLRCLDMQQKVLMHFTKFDVDFPAKANMSIFFI